MFQISKDGTFLDFKAAKTIDLIVSPSEFKNTRVAAPRYDTWCKIQVIVSGYRQILSNDLGCL